MAGWVFGFFLSNSSLDGNLLLKLCFRLVCKMFDNRVIISGSVPNRSSGRRGMNRVWDGGDKKEFLCLIVIPDYYFK